jgi:hypothetical protein
MAGLVYPGLPWAVFKGTDAVTLLSTIKTTLLGLQATATAASQDAVCGREKWRFCLWEREMEVLFVGERNGDASLWEREMEVFGGERCGNRVYMRG